MTRCNLLKPIIGDNANAGGFYTFSQYGEDLTKAAALGYEYRVVPSKFAVVKLRACNPLNTPLKGKSTGVPSKDLAKIFQCYLENKAAFCRNTLGSSNTDAWNPQIFSILFWGALEEFNLIDISAGTTQQDKNSADHSIRYIGDINIYNSNEHDAVSYNETYCHIPSNEYAYAYAAGTNNQQTDQFQWSKDYIKNADGTFATQLVGWTNGEADYPTTLTTLGITNEALLDSYSTSSSTKATYSIGLETYPLLLSPFISDVEGAINNINSGLTGKSYTQLSLRSYDFNAVLVFYDIYNSLDPDNPKLYCNIPMGLYVTGEYEDTDLNDSDSDSGMSDWVMTNSVTKYVTNEDAFGSGTSYGLKICNRFTVGHNQTLLATNIAVDSETDEDDVTNLENALVMLGDLTSEMRENTEALAGLTQNMKEFLSAFRNNKTNVPYIIYVDDVPYWFVNGKNTGVAVNMQSVSALHFISTGSSS